MAPAITNNRANGVNRTNNQNRANGVNGGSHGKKKGAKPPRNVDSDSDSSSSSSSDSSSSDSSTSTAFFGFVARAAGARAVRKRWVWIVGACLGVSILGGGAWWAWHKSHKPKGRGFLIYGFYCCLLVLVSEYF